MGVLHTIICLLFFLHNVTMYNEGVYICFSSWTLKLSKLKLNSYLLALTKLNVDYLPKDESYPLKVHYNIQVRFILNDPLKTGTTIPKCFSKFVLAYPAVLHSALARLMSWRCSCIILLGLKTFMGSCP
jgi:hypothetical protein